VHVRFLTEGPHAVTTARDDRCVGGRCQDAGPWGRTIVSAAPPSEAPQGSAEIICVREDRLPRAAVPRTLTFAAERPIPFTRAEEAPGVERLRREQAERCLQRLLVARGSAQGIAHLVEQELISLQSQDLRKLDELVTARLQYAVVQLWEHGWQPLDLLHVMYKAGPRLAPIIAAVITNQANAVHGWSRAPQDWLNQLEVVADEAGELAAGNDQQASWLLVVAMCKSGLGLVEAWVDIITVAASISELPVLERIAPPPSEWGKAVDRVTSDSDSERDRVLKRIRALLARRRRLTTQPRPRPLPQRPRT
jgi:hypothetical protein